MKIDDTTGLNKEYGIKKMQNVYKCVCKRVKKVNIGKKTPPNTKITCTYFKSFKVRYIFYKNSFDPELCNALLSNDDG